MIARRLGVSIATVRRYEAAGHLHPIRGEDGWAVYFEGDEVDALAEHIALIYGKKKRRPLATSQPDGRLSGRSAARIFALHKAGKTFAEIVIATQCAPDTVRAAIHEFEMGYDGAQKEKERRLAELEVERHQRETDRYYADLVGKRKSPKLPSSHVRAVPTAVPTAPTLLAPVATSAPETPPPSPSPPAGDAVSQIIQSIIGGKK